MKIKGLKKAIGEYNRANRDGAYSPRYGILMFDYSDGEIWTDEFYDLGHGSWNEYHSDTIINLGAEMKRRGIHINMGNTKEFINDNWEYWSKNGLM